MSKIHDSLLDAISSADENLFLVDFWSPSCGPCRQLMPVLENLAKELKGMMRFGKVNVAENFEIAQSMNIEVVPTIIIFEKEGNSIKIAERWNGVNLQQFVARLRELASKS